AEALVSPAVCCAVGLDREQIRTSSAVQPSTFNLQPCAQRALGEIGLDYHYSPETRAAQMKLFAEQLEEARRRDLPVVIHTREADDDTLALLREIPSRGIIHCYTGTPEYAKRFLDLGFFISISGIVTFRPADNVRASALVVPDDRILIETDSPFLAPVPMRGQPNEPAFIAHTCEFLAKLRGISADAFAELTFANAERILG
ncbi:MAG: TatD family hydrolase, partial [bacterium]|nr:TatD family hydrolase [Candidatus Colisoma equi]